MLWAILVILLTSMSYFDSAVLLDEAARTALHDRVHKTGSTDVLVHIGGWRMSVSPTLVESSVATPGPC